MGECPIHKGDNPTALNFYHTGHTSVGNWQCKTNGCHSIFGGNALGLIRGLLSQQNGWNGEKSDEISYKEAIRWCEKFFNKEFGRHETPTKRKPKEKPPYTTDIPNEKYLSSRLRFPADYFNKRGFSKDVLMKFNVGYCWNPKSSMYTRAVVPLHNGDGSKVIGYSGRSTHPKCDICNCYHSDFRGCPEKEKRRFYSKWKNSPDYPALYDVYNFHRAKTSIEKNKFVIIVEGQPNIWRLSEAGFDMCIAGCGGNFTSFHKKILQQLDFETIIILPDTGKPGEILPRKVKSQCEEDYKIICVEPTWEDDIGECSVKFVKDLLNPILGEINGSYQLLSN